MTNAATILDMCCGSRMFWFDKQDERAVFTDKGLGYVVEYRELRAYDYVVRRMKWANILRC